MFKETKTAIIIPVNSYNFYETCRFACSKNSKHSPDRFINGTYSRILRGDNKFSFVSAVAENNGEIKITVKGNILTDSSVEKSVKIISRIIGADQIPNKFYEMAHEDPLLRPLVDRFKGLHIPQSETVFEALILSILGQQISTQVAAILRAELIMNYGESIEVDGSIQYAFPTPEILSHVSVQELRQHKLSARKAEYIRQIALMESRGIIELESFRSMDADEATRQLVDLKGVGNWTAHWLLVRALSFNDGFPSGDLALQKYMGHLINDGKIMDDRQLLRYSERWMPYRSWVTTYMFADIRELPQNT